MVRLYTFLLLLLLSFTGAASTATPASSPILIIEDAWIAEAPPNSKVMVAYMTITNPSSEKIEIVSAESTIYSSIEFHETVHQDGLARMVRYDEIPVSANGSVHFKRGGKHLMLFNPNRQLKAGDKVTVSFTTKDNKTLSTIITVIKAQF